MNRSGIEWCDHTFNPITGCLTGCPYCYARSMVRRFSGDPRTNKQHKDKYTKKINRYDTASGTKKATLYLLDEPFMGEDGNKIIYPFGFDITLHKYRENELDGLKSGCKVFVGAMTDIFGPWIPDEWIVKIFEICEDHPNNQYIFLTKWPTRYVELKVMGLLPNHPNFWYGTSITKPEDQFFSTDEFNCWVSMEPLEEEFFFDQDEKETEEGFKYIKWIVTGAETGNRRGKVKPDLLWIEEIRDMADRQGIPLFMKDSLLTIVKESDMRREWPDAMLESKPGPGWKRTRYSTCAVCGMEYKKGEMATIEARGARGTSSQPLEEMEETKPVREIIEEVQTEICDHYCKYTDGYKDADDEKYSDLVNRYCVSCPLNRL